MFRKFDLVGRVTGCGHPTYVAAEISGDHNCDISRAFSIIVAEDNTGADNIKMQSYRANTITIDHWDMVSDI
ncbi:MAG: hypothetical protein CMM28_13985 [Rhodospirillaceae bacterium]|nr:hypothetical protein [Rhodospirillaceae bacterium]